MTPPPFSLASERVRAALVFAVLVLAASCASPEPAADDSAVAATTRVLSVPALQSTSSPPSSSLSASSSGSDIRAGAPQPSDDAPIVGWSDSDLLAVLAFLLEVGGREAAVIAFSTNVPEDEVMDCMAERGFEYAREAGPEELADQDPRFSMPANDYAVAYGLGITATALNRLPVLEPTANEEYLAALNGAAAEAYGLALSECKGNTPERNQVSIALTTAVEMFRPILDVDPAVMEAAGAWDACMIEAGFEFGAPQTMRQQFWNRVGQSPDEAQLDAIFEDEVRAALANLNCEPSYLETYRAVMTQRFNEFESLVESALNDPSSTGQNG
jgi:hypothetical protein